MCGIVGGITNQDITPLLIEGLKRLEYRGYDSSGLAVLTKNNAFSRDKFSNSFLERLFFELLSLSIISNSSNLFMDLEIVFQLVSVPPSHLLFTKYCSVSKDNSFTIFEQDRKSVV